MTGFLITKPASLKDNSNYYLLENGKIYIENNTNDKLDIIGLEAAPLWVRLNIESKNYDKIETEL